VRMRGDNEAWVVNQLSDSVSMVNLITMRVERTVRVGDEPADINSSGAVDAADVAMMLANWGQSGTGDINGDGSVAGDDLAQLLSAWGPCGG